MSLGNSSFTHSPPVNLRLPLDPRLQEIEELVAVTPRGQPSGSLNKKRSQNNDTLDRSTRRKPSRFEHVERDFSSSQREIRRSGIRGNAVQRGQINLKIDPKIAHNLGQISQHQEILRGFQQK